MLLSVTLAFATVAPVLSVTTPRNDVVPVCAQTHVTAKSNATEEIRRFRFTIAIDHFIDCSFRAPQLKIGLYTGGQHQADTKIMRRFAGSQPGEKLRPWATFPTTQPTKL